MLEKLPVAAFVLLFIMATALYHSPISPLWLLIGKDDLPSISTSTFIGIVVAISGNVLISLALNLQKLAHKRLSNERKSRGEASAADGNRTPTNHARILREIHVQSNDESQPLNRDFRRTYGGAPSDESCLDSPSKKPAFFSRIIPVWFKKSKPGPLTPQDSDLLPVDILTADSTRVGQVNMRKRSVTTDTDNNENDYLKSKLWWLGFFIMNIGELGNFISYAWAPASVVAPLGTFALMANCAFAPLMLGERFRMRDLFGILVAILGAVTVVIASNASDVRLDPEALLKAISQPAFIAYTCIYAIAAAILGVLSRGRIGKQYVFVDIGMCALFGGFTVLSTKAISTLLTLNWIDMFRQWITYPVLAVLVLTGVGQIRYLNRALMRFDSKVVIPIQFVLFTLSAIIGSAILYGDFRRAKFHQVTTFLYGCSATFAGVFIIAWDHRTEPPTGDHIRFVEPDPTLLGSSGRSPIEDGASLDLGSIRRRGIMAHSPVRDSGSLRHKPSTISLIGLSPAQGLLLVQTPPRDITDPRSRQWERDHDMESQLTDSPRRRRRTMSWFGDDSRAGSTYDAGGNSTISERLRSGASPGSEPSSHNGRPPARIDLHQ